MDLLRPGFESGPAAVLDPEHRNSRDPCWLTFFFFFFFFWQFPTNVTVQRFEYQSVLLLWCCVTSELSAVRPLLLHY